MTGTNLQNITIDPILLPGNTNGKFHVLRLDKIHDLISGNKWFKLKFYLEDARMKGRKGILTFGGAYSNHLLASAAACNMNGFEAIGVVRGERPARLSSTLKEAERLGMQLHFSSREDYAEKKIPSSIETKDLLVVEEGGYGETGANGASEIVTHISQHYTHICCAVGTGTMMAGLINALPSTSAVVGISVMKNNHSLENAVSALLKKQDVSWQINHEFHFGGYAKHPAELISFMNELYQQSNIPSDIVYTSKLFYGINELARCNTFAETDKILIVHSGGLQGNNSLQKGTLIY